MRTFNINNTTIEAILVDGTFTIMTSLDAIDKMEIGSAIFTRMGNTSDTDWDAQTHETNCVVLSKQSSPFGNYVTVFSPELNIVGYSCNPYQYMKADGTIGIGLYCTSAFNIQMAQDYGKITSVELDIINKVKQDIIDKVKTSLKSE